MYNSLRGLYPGIDFPRIDVVFGRKKTVKSL